MYEYGNARIAAMRGRLLSPRTLQRLVQSVSLAWLLDQLRLQDDWRAPLEDASISGDHPQGMILAGIEAHRSARLGSLPHLYPPPERRLVEALVMPLDIERVIGILRRRRAGESPDAICADGLRGGLLDARQLATIVHAPTFGSAFRTIGRMMLVGQTRADRLAAMAEGVATWDAIEAEFVDACGSARDARVAGRGPNAGQVRSILATERSAGRAVLAELSEGGIVAAASLERLTTLARLDGLARRARRDPLGVGVVAGYVAAVEAQAIRLRAIVARADRGWSRDRAAMYLTPPSA